jgi:aminoglycoside phosphotransferase (APT) family kinase protein
MDDPTQPDGHAPTEDQLEAIRASEPDPLGLMDVMELIAPEARVTGWSRLHGGFGAAMHRVEVTMPSGARTAFVLRRYLPELGDDGRVATRTAATLEGLRGSVVRAPEVLWLDADGRVFHRPALAMTLLPGRLRSADVPTDPAVLAGLAQALVQLQWVPVDEGFDHLPAYPDLDALLDPLRAAADDLPTSEVVDTRAVVDTVLGRAAGVEAAPAGLCHGDFHVGNVLFHEGRVTGVVDWDHARVADPRADVAYCAMDLALLAGPDAARAFLDEHARLRGPMPDEPWWRLWAATRAFPDPLDWIPAWRAIGVEITPDEVTARYVAWVDAAMADLRG